MTTRILCIDADETLLELFDYQLKINEPPQGFDVALASSYEGAEREIKTGKWDLITTSLALPIGDPLNPKVQFGGLELLSNLRSGVYGMDKEDTPVIVISGAKNLAGIMAETISSPEITWHLTKPFSVRNLMKLIHKAMEAGRS